MESIDRDVLLIRLANELEEFLDLGILYSGEERRRQSIDADRPIGLMADKLGYPALATEINKAFAETIRAEVPHTLRGNGKGHIFSHRTQIVSTRNGRRSQTLCCSRATGQDEANS